MKDFTAEIDRSLDMMFQVEELQKKKTLLLDKPKYVYLQVMVFKIPFTAPRNRKLVRLRHSLYGDEPEICLFVPNRKTSVGYKITTDELIDFCVDYYTELLEKHKVKGITTIMPFKQLRSEYGTYDLRRKLVRRFDLFLCKKSLLYNTEFISSLGKIFKVANKIPFGVPFPKEDSDFDPEFKENIEKAIHTSGFYISRYSDNYSIPIGTVANTKKELKENLEMVLKQLFERQIIPGGLQNVRAMYLWPSQSKSIPFYFNLEVPVGLKPPRDRVKKKKRKGVEGELSTQPYKKVFVAPTGEVFVSKLETKSKKKKVTPEPPEIDFEDDESFKDDSDVDDEEDRNDILKNKIKAVREEGDTEAEDDEETEKREKRLLGAKSFKDDSDVDDEEDKKDNLKTKKKLEKEEDDTETEDDEEIEKREMRFLEERRQAEEEESEEERGQAEEEESEEEEETNKNLSKKQKSKRKRKNASGEERTIAAKKKKSGKGEQKEKIKKAQRKALMKQEKCKLKEKINQKRKSKQKKV